MGGSSTYVQHPNHPVKDNMSIADYMLLSTRLKVSSDISQANFGLL